MTTRQLYLSVALAALTVGAPFAAVPAADDVDLDAVYRIKDEGLQRSQVVEIASFLTDVYGPRLTGSPNIREAADWAQTRLKQWQLTNVQLHKFPFGRGWQNRRFVAEAVSPRAYPLIGFPKAWTAGTRGPVTGEAVLVRLGSEDDFAAWRGKLRGKFVLTARPPVVTPNFEAQGSRFSEVQLADLFRQPSTVSRRATAPATGPGALSPEFLKKRTQFLADEGVLVQVEGSIIGDGGTFFVQGAAGVSREPADPAQLPQVVLAVEHYGRIVRTLEKKIPVTLTMDIANEFFDEDLDGFSVLADIPGGDKADEVVIAGAHLDSWHAGTGATDNAAGAAVMMEAMRILKTTGVRLRRTVRLGLWGGEEQGLLGSKAYVRDRIADVMTMQVKAEHGKVSAYYNLDNGTGRIRGVYLQGNEAVAPVFQAWMEPFRNLGMTTLAIRETSNSDHVAFDAAGIPAFQFIQDPIEYDTRTHHSNQDLHERLLADDLARNAVIIASFIHHTANRDDRLPRKPLPRPQRPPARTTTESGR
jgi:carboxypeptidase Q